MLDWKWDVPQCGSPPAAWNAPNQGRHFPRGDGGLFLFPPQRAGRRSGRRPALGREKICNSGGRNPRRLVIIRTEKTPGVHGDEQKTVFGQSGNSSPLASRDHEWLVMAPYERTDQGLILDGRLFPWEELIPARVFLRMCRRCAGRLKLVDSLGTKLTGRQLLLRTLVLQRLLAREVLAPREEERFVGVLIPPSAGGAVVNAALALQRRVAVNLNFTLSRNEIDHCIHTAGIRRVLTSRKAMEKLQLEFDAEVVYLDDLREKVTLGDKLAGLWGAYVQSIASLERQFQLQEIDPDDLLTVIFTSGSTSMPKGVMLTHANIGSNVRAAETVVQLSDQDVMLCCVPFFHSLGYTITMWGALMLGFQGVCHVSPLDATIIGRLAREHRATILISTPTFLRNYMRRLDPEDFASLDLVITGAEKLPQDLADAFEKHFGIRPLEGYGTTELSPLVSVNVPQHRSQDGKPHVRQGSVGQPVPGVAARVVDPETKEPLPTGTDGMLWITGPNVLPAPAGQNGRGDLRRLVRNRRHRPPGRRRLHLHHRAAEPFFQDRRRDGAAHQDRGGASARLGTGRGRTAGGRHRHPRSEKGRTARGALHPQRQVAPADAASSDRPRFAQHLHPFGR